MYKKLIISGLLILSTWSIVPGQEIIPYENVIRREYNRMRGNADRYTSIDEIMNQTLRGKSNEQKNQIIADLKSLKHAVHAALEQAKHDGKRMWFWAYIWKDNEPAIQTLAQYGYDISDRLVELEWQSQTDLTKVLWYSTKYTAVAIVTIIALWGSQEYLSGSQDHSLIELLAAPARKGIDVANITTQYLLAGIMYSSAGIALAAQYGVDFFAPKQPVQTFEPIQPLQQPIPAPAINAHAPDQFEKIEPGSVMKSKINPDGSIITYVVPPVKKDGEDNKKEQPAPKK